MQAYAYCFERTPQNLLRKLESMLLQIKMIEMMKLKTPYYYYVGNTLFYGKWFIEC